MDETPLIDTDLLRLLVDPLTGEKLEFVDDKLVSKSHIYPVQEGVPILLWKSAKTHKWSRIFLLHQKRRKFIEKIQICYQHH